MPKSKRAKVGVFLEIGVNVDGNVIACGILSYSMAGVVCRWLRAAVLHMTTAFPAATGHRCSGENGVLWFT